MTRRLAEDVTLQPGAVRVLQPWFTELQHWENERAASLLTAHPTAATPLRKPLATTGPANLAASRSRS